MKIPSKILGNLTSIYAQFKQAEEAGPVGQPLDSFCEKVGG